MYCICIEVGVEGMDNGNIQFFGYLRSKEKGKKLILGVYDIRFPPIYLFQNIIPQGQGSVGVFIEGGEVRPYIPTLTLLIPIGLLVTSNRQHSDFITKSLQCLHFIQHCSGDPTLER